MKGIFRCTMGKGTQNKRTYGTPWVHQKEARANKIGQLRKAEAALSCKTFEVDYEDLKLKAHKPGQQSERLQDDKNSAVVEAESRKMLA